MTSKYWEDTLPSITADARARPFIGSLLAPALCVRTRAISTVEALRAAPCPGARRKIVGVSAWRGESVATRSRRQHRHRNQERESKGAKHRSQDQWANADEKLQFVSRDASRLSRTLGGVDPLVALRNHAPMTELDALLGHRFIGTTVQSWLIAAALAIIIVFVLTIARRFTLQRVRRWAEATATRLDDVVVSLIESLRVVFFVAIGLWVAAEYATLSASAQRFARVAISLCTLLQIGLSLQALVRRLARGWAPADSDGATRTAASASAFLASLTIWALLIISGLSVLGFEISALIAGLGVGGVAAALAVQNILGDLFASLSIYFDRPFNLGDFIIVDSEMGTVEKIGLRTTRVRALSGEEIIFANGDLTKSRVRNFKRMAERRVQFGFGVEYTTPLERLREIPQVVTSIIAARDGTRFDRAHFKEYGDFALNFEVVFYVLSPDYNVFMDHQQAINLDIFAAFAQRGIQFAFPTQKILLASEGPGNSERGRAVPDAASLP